jgi:hypothetical protein
MELEQLEALALADDRAAALAGLLPGTMDHDYWRGVHLQHRGSLDEVDAILSGWSDRHRDRGELYQRLERRQLLLRAGRDLAAHADAIRREAGLTLDDQAEAAAAAQRYPTSLDPAVVDEAAVIGLAFDRASDLSELTAWALASPAVRERERDAGRRRDLFRRLPRANLPGVLALVVEELVDPRSRGFGALPIEHLLTLDQLVELGGLVPALCQDGAWVTAVLGRLRPRAHVDVETDLDARRAFLDALWKFVDALAPSFNALKAQVLYHQLDLDRRAGAFDRERFLRYLALPRQAPYVDAGFLRRFPADQLVEPGANPGEAAGLEPAGDDEALVRDHLEHFLRTEEVDAFADVLQRDWLRNVLAVVRLTSGDPDAARWAGMLPEGDLTALRERVDIELSPRNPRRFGADDPVALTVVVKNVAELTVKVFRVNALAYFLARGAEVDTSLDLDGMVASDARVELISAAPIRRTALRLELPGCARPGTYVVELIGSGKSSRALIKKGGLRPTVRVGAAGPTVRVCDDAGRALPGARIWMGGREYAPREDGEISIPFSTQPGRVPMLLLHGDVAQREVFHHPAEVYDLTAGIHLERQTLVPGKTAKVLLRPMLSVAGWPAPIALLEEPRVAITVTDLAGTSSIKEDPVVLRDDAETVVSLRVPEDAVKVGVRLRGRVRVVSTQQTIDLEDGAEGEHNLVHRSLRTELMHLATTELGHVFYLLGKTGEARAGCAVRFSVKHVAVTFDVAVTLSTDERGRVELGRLPGVERVAAVLPSGSHSSWSLWPETHTPRAVHAEARAEITLPAPPGVAAGDLALSLSLTEVRAGVAVRDFTDRARLDRGALVIAGLEPGEYALSCPGFPDGIAITVAPACDGSPGWSTSGTAMIELSPPLPLCRGIAVEGEDLVVRISDAGPRTRVHLVAALFRPDPALPRSLRAEPRAPLAVETPPVLSHYVSGRDIGDEYRYVLERRRAARRPGVLLDKPSLLLDPWALRTTSTAVQTAAGGGLYGASPPRPAAPAPAMQPMPRADATDETGFATVDFLAAPAVVLENLRPDADGLVRVRRADLGAAQLVRAVIVDPALTSDADLALPEVATAHRDRRLRLALDPAGHFAEDRRVEPLPSGAQIVVDDVRTGRLELVSTVARAHQVLLTLGGGDALREFGFVAQWSLLDAAARRDKYSRYACHELNLFLSVKDPAFFAEVVRPHLVNRRHQTFIDRWLLGEDLSAYLEPWAFGRLNTLERVLLARRVPALQDAVARLIGDAVDLIPPDPERDARLVDTLLGAAALEEGGVAAVASAAPEPEMDALESITERSEPRPKAKKAAPPARSKGGMMPPSGAPSFGPPASAGPAGAMASLEMLGGFGGGGARDEADLRERGNAQALYRGADRTQEWAETGWWKKRIEEATPDLVEPNRFWRDLAAHREGPFLSPHLGECASSFAAALSALAFLDLPFVAGAHDMVLDDTRLTVTARSHALAARTYVAEVAAPEARGAVALGGLRWGSPAAVPEGPLPQLPPPQTPLILVGQSYFRADDRWAWDGAERREKHVEGELLTGVVYQCQVVVTNPSSAPQRLDVLLQIPRGAVPVSSGFLTRTMHLQLGPYGTQALEYAFYFPAPGSWTHFPAHAIRAGALVAFAPPATLVVVHEPTTVDAGSWAHVSQHGTLDEVLAFLEGSNLGRVDLGRVAFRMRDRDAFTRVTALLAARRVYDDRLWAYGLAHADRARVAEWLRHQDAFVQRAGSVLDGAAVDLDPVARGTFQHLEYAPLVNARAHQLGKRRRILNDALASQYQAFLDVTAHRASARDDDLLAAAHYLFCLDRVDDALAAFGRVRPDQVSARLQYDYLAAYAACCRGDLAAARRLAAPWTTHPVDRWRNRFAALGATLDEAEGRAPGEGFSAAVDPENRDQKMGELAARQPSLDLAIEGGGPVLQHHHLASCQLRFYRMDIELVFSRQPFVQGDVERFSWIEPGQVVELPLGGDGRTPVTIPEAMRGENLVVEAVAPGLRARVAHYAHDLAAQVAHQYGQIRVLRASTQAALSATYVKVYARQRGGAVAFYKDGYTDLRGRFDYVTLSTDDLDRVERFAILVVSDDAGATVLEAPPPQR